MKDIAELTKKIKRKQREQDLLLNELIRSITIKELLAKHNITPSWPVTVTVRRVPGDEAFFSFKNSAGSVFLRLSHSNVPEILYPAQLKKDLTKEGRK